MGAMFKEWWGKSSSRSAATWQRIQKTDRSAGARRLEGSI
jgi:hypothetical protein